MSMCVGMQCVCVFVLVCRMCVGGTEGQSSANVWKGALAWREAAECRDLYLSLPRPPAPGRRDGCRGRSGSENVGGEVLAGERWINLQCPRYNSFSAQYLGDGGSWCSLWLPNQLF